MEEDDELLAAFDLEGVERTAAQHRQEEQLHAGPAQPGPARPQHLVDPVLHDFAFSRAGGQANKPADSSRSAVATPAGQGSHIHVPTAADLLKAAVPQHDSAHSAGGGVVQQHQHQVCQQHHAWVQWDQQHGQMQHWHQQQPQQQQQQQHNQHQHQQQVPLLQPVHQQLWQPDGRHTVASGPQQGFGSAAAPCRGAASGGFGLGQGCQTQQQSSWPLQQPHPQQQQQHAGAPQQTMQQRQQPQQQPHQQHLHKPSWNQQQFGHMQQNSTAHPGAAWQQQRGQHYHAGRALQQNWQQRLQQQQQELQQQLCPEDLIPRCPYKQCPGVFSQCGAVLHWRERRNQGFYACSLWPLCDYRYFPAQQVPHPELGCEVLDSQHFRLAPQPAAEVAVRRSGGIRAVLKAAGIQLGHLELPQQQPAASTANPTALADADTTGTNSAPAGTAEPAAAADSSAVAAASGDGGAGAELAAGPQWEWSDAESMLFPLCKYELVEQLLRSCKPPLLGRGGAIPPATLAAFREPEADLATESEVSARFAAMPVSLKDALMPFQREGVLYGLTRKGRVLIADEMGVGKTVQALAMAACYQEEWPLLIIVPASLRLVWAEEIERWLPHIRPGDVTVIEGKDDRLNDLPDLERRASLPAITITSYEMMKRLSCAACQKLQGGAATAAAKAAAARQAEAPAAAAAATAAAASDAGGCCGSNSSGGPAAAQPSGGQGSAASGRGRGRGRGRKGQAVEQDSAAAGSEDHVLEEAALPTGCMAPAGQTKPGGVAGKRCRGCTGPDHCMAALPWGVVIIDESHNLRTTNSRQADSPHTEAAVAAASAAPRVVLLSGTPSLSRPYDLFRQVDVLQPGILGRTKEEFAHRYCDRRLVPVCSARSNPGPGGGPRLRWNNAGGARLVELHGLLVRRVMVRRLKKDVLKQLPPKRRQVIRLPHPPAHRWPKEDNEQQQQQPNDQQQQQQPTDGRPQQQQEAPAGDPSSSGSMTATHRVALAKLPDAIEWLMAALGTSQPDGEQGASRGGSRKGAADKAAPGLGSGPGPGRAAAGPLLPAWQRGGGSSGGGSRASSVEGPSDSVCEGAAAGEEEEEGDGEEEGAESSAGQQGGGAGPKFLVFAHHKDVMDKLAAALAGYGSHLPDTTGPAAAAAPGLDPDLALELARQAGRDSSLSGGSNGSNASAARQAWRGVGYVRVDGSHDSTERLAAVKKFKQDPSCRVALLSITAAAVGLDFSSASMVVFVELPHEVSLVRQAEDRAHRKGQAAKAVNVYFLCAQGTVDDKQWQALNLSLAHINQVHDGEVLPQPLARAAIGAAADDAAADAEADPMHAAAIAATVAAAAAQAGDGVDAAVPGHRDGGGDVAGPTAVAAADGVGDHAKAAAGSVGGIEGAAADGAAGAADGSAGASGGEGGGCVAGALGGAGAMAASGEGVAAAAATAAVTAAAGVAADGAAAEGARAAGGSGRVGQGQQLADGRLHPAGTALESPAAAAAAQEGAAAAAAGSGGGSPSAQQQCMGAAGAVAADASRAVEATAVQSCAVGVGHTTDPAATAVGADGAAAGAAAGAGGAADCREPAVVDLTADSPVKSVTAGRNTPSQVSPSKYCPLALTPCSKSRTNATAAGLPFAAAGEARAGAHVAIACYGSTPAAAARGPATASTMEQAPAAAPPAAAAELEPCKDHQQQQLGGVCLTPIDPEVWFEVSKHTNRLHFHLAPDGSKPLGLNIPLEFLLLPEEGTLQQLAAAWDAAWQQQQQQRRGQERGMSCKRQREEGPQHQQEHGQQQQQKRRHVQQPGGDSQHTVSSPFFTRHGAKRQDSLQQQQRCDSALQPDQRYTPQRQQQQQHKDPGLQERISPTAAAVAAAAAAAGSASAAAGAGAAGSVGRQAVSRGPAGFPAAQPTPVPSSTGGVPGGSSRGRPISALDSLRAVMPFGHCSPAKLAAEGQDLQHPPAAVAGAAAADGVRQGPHVPCCPAAAAGCGGVEEEVLMLAATPSPTIAAAVVAAAASGGQGLPYAARPLQQDRQQQQPAPCYGHTGSLPCQHAAVAGLCSCQGPGVHEGSVRSSPARLQRMRRLLSQDTSNYQEQNALFSQKQQYVQQESEEKALQAVSEQQQQQQQHVEEQEEGDSQRQEEGEQQEFVGASPGGLSLYLDSEDEGDAGADMHEVVVIPASEDSEGEDEEQQQRQQEVAMQEQQQQQPEPGTQQQQQQQLPQHPAMHVDLLSQSPGCQPQARAWQQQQLDQPLSQQQLDPPLSQQPAVHVDLLSQSPAGKRKIHQQSQQQAQQPTQQQQSQLQSQQQQSQRQLDLQPSQQQRPGLQREQPAVEHGQQQHAAVPSEPPDCRFAAGFMSPSGLACLTLPLSPLALLELLRQGAAFAADWAELRSVTRNRLVGRVLPPDLASAVEAAQAAAASAGAFGISTTRYLQDIQEGDPNLPAGARLVNVTVHYPNGRQQLVTYRQAFTGGHEDGSPLVRHCINCFKGVEGAGASEDAVLAGSLDLFCSLECERAWSIKSSSGGIRRALFKLERGVCQMCQLDCHALVGQLQQIAKDSTHWLQHRRAVVAALAPKLLERGHGSLLDRLLNTATEGNAWHADHILAVYEGGGGCDLDNLRTLCVACHAAVTKRQAAARAAERQRRKLGTADIRLWFGGLPGGGGAGGGAGKPQAALKRKRRARVDAEGPGVQFVDDTPELEGAKVQARTTAAAAAAGRGVDAAAAAGKGKKRGRPPKKQQAGVAGKGGSATSKGASQIHKWVASAGAAAATQGAARSSGIAAVASNAADGGIDSAAATPHPSGGAIEVIELLDCSQPCGSDTSSPVVPDSAAAALRTTPQTQRRAVKRHAAAAAAASGAGAGVAGLRTVLDQFRFSQESSQDGARQVGPAAAGQGPGPSKQRQEQQLGNTQPSSSQGHGRDKKQQQQQPTAKRRGGSKRRRQAGLISDSNSDGGSGSEGGGEDSDFADSLNAAEKKQLGAAAAAQAAAPGVQARRGGGRAGGQHAAAGRGKRKAAE